MITVRCSPLPHRNPGIVSVNSLSGRCPSKLNVISICSPAGGLCQCQIQTPPRPALCRLEQRKKSEKCFQTVQRDFQERLRLEPAGDLEALNTRFWHWLESEYHRRAHSAWVANIRLIASPKKRPPCASFPPGLTTVRVRSAVAKIRRGTDQLDRGEGIPEDQLDAYLAKLKAQPE